MLRAASTARLSLLRPSSSVPLIEPELSRTMATATAPSRPTPIHSGRASVNSRNAMSSVRNKRMSHWRRRRRVLSLGSMRVKKSKVGKGRACFRNRKNRWNRMGSPASGRSERKNGLSAVMPVIGGSAGSSLTKTGVERLLDRRARVHQMVCGLAAATPAANFLEEFAGLGCVHLAELVHLDR